MKFSRSALGQEIRQDVEDGIRSLVSVGYFIDELTEVKREDDGTDTVIRTLTGDQFEREMRELHGDTFARSGLAAARGKNEKPPTFVVTRWTPFEASVVPIPADVNAGFGKSAGVDSGPEQQQKAETPRIIVLEQRKMEHEQKTPAELEIVRRDAIASRSW